MYWRPLHQLPQAGRYACHACATVREPPAGPAPAPCPALRPGPGLAAGLRHGPRFLKKRRNLPASTYEYPGRGRLRAGRLVVIPTQLFPFPMEPNHGNTPSGSHGTASSGDVLPAPLASTAPVSGPVGASDRTYSPPKAHRPPRSSARHAGKQQKVARRIGPD
ncbi:MAG: hypothetical protein WKG07_14645 [Hymenobacter sp.]